MGVGGRGWREGGGLHYAPCMSPSSPASSRACGGGGCV